MAQCNRDNRFRASLAKAAYAAFGTAVLASIGACTASDGRREAPGGVRYALTTVSFQQNVLPSAAYTGSTDATLRQATPTTNAGAAPTCLVDGDDAGAGDLSCVLRWSLSGIPAGSSVQSASITLNVTNGTGNSYDIYALRRPWNEAEVSWNQATSSSAWATPGALASSDRGALIGTISGAALGTVTIPLNAAGVAAVQSWLNDASNFGIVIAHATSTDGLDIASTESANAPRLTVTYEPPSGPLIARGSTWKYLDNGTDQGTAWRASAFNDAGWATGAAELGYGDGDETTIINSGPTGAFFVTSYFRRAFSVSNPASITALNVGLDIDDGAVIYLNGTELLRTNMPAGAVTAATRASSTVDGGWFTTRVDGATLSANNVLAAEVHQVSTTSSDVSFDLELTPASGPAPVPKLTRSYNEIPGDLINPERGWYGRINLRSGSSFTSTRSAGRSIAYAPVVLRMDGVAIPTVVSQVQTGLNAVRNAGLKVIFRIHYNDPPDGENPIIDRDPDIATIESDIAAFAGILQNNADVISVVQLGFVGPWGEYHGSHILTEGNSSRVVNKLFSVMPAGMMTQFRTPLLKKTHFGRGQLADSEAFTGTAVARSGHFNDCFLSSINDTGTYYEPQTESRALVAQDTRFTPMGGETCGPGQRAACDTALDELARFHWSFINQEHWLPVVSPDPAVGLWARSPACRPEITERLGYRFVLEQVTHSQAVRPGDVLELDVRLRNEGFAAPYNARPLYAVLQGPSGPYTALLSPAIDPRRWEPGIISFSRRLTVPVGAAPGTYTLSLWLPDAAPSIRARPEYAIRFASDGGWNSTTGYNVLTTNLSVATGAAPNPGSGDVSFQ